MKIISAIPKSKIIVYPVNRVFIVPVDELFANIIDNVIAHVDSFVHSLDKTNDIYFCQ